MTVAQPADGGEPGGSGTVLPGRPDAARPGCPKCGVPCEPSSIECPRCGLIYAKYRERPREPLSRSAEGDGPAVLDHLLSVRPGTADSELVAKGAVMLALFVWGWWFIAGPVEGGYAMRSFMHFVNIPFHEAGHVLFGIFGSRLITSFGGSLLQVMMPLACACVLLLSTRDPLGAAAALWWAGESLIDLAPYMADARALSLPLLGGNTGATAPYGFHDWNYILSETGLLRHDKRIAALSHDLGAFVMLAAVAWGGAVIVRAFRRGGRERREGAR